MSSSHVPRDEPRDALALLRSILESPPDLAIFAVDVEGRYLTFNGAHRANVLRETGRDIALGEDVRQAFDRRQADWLTEQLERALRGDAVSLRTSHSRTLGRPRHDEYLFAPIRDEAREVIGVTVMRRDVSQEVLQALERTRVAHQQRSMLALAERLARLRGTDALLEDVRQQLGRILAVDYACLTERLEGDSFVENVLREPGAQASGPYRAPGAGTAPVALTALDGTAVGEVFATGQTLASHHFALHAFRDWSRLHHEAQLNHLVVFPVHAGDRVVATLTLGLVAQAAPSTAELDLMAQFASLFGAHLTAQRALEDFELLHLELEERVQSKTELLQRALREKDALLREQHHGIRNNLQIVSSLLNMQRKQIQEPRMRELFSRSIHRVRAIAMVHENLHGPRGMERILLDTYLRRIADAARSTFAPHAIVELDADSVAIPVDLAVPID